MFPRLLLTTVRRKEQLGLYGNQLNYMQTAWTVGYVIGEIPSNIVLTRVRPSLWIPTMEVKRTQP
jgi:ACS family pantothenate transporter-like MFS transporter